MSQARSQDCCEKRICSREASSKRQRHPLSSFQSANLIGFEKSGRILCHRRSSHAFQRLKALGSQLAHLIFPRDSSHRVVLGKTINVVRINEGTKQDKTTEGRILPVVGRSCNVVVPESELPLFIRQAVSPCTVR
jgi:hypothetical protein